LLFAGSARAGDVPGWVREAARAPDPPGSERASAVILWSEKTVDWRESFHEVVRTRTVIRVHTMEGARYANAGAVYCAGKDKVLDLTLWILERSGHASEFDKDVAVDHSLRNEDLHSEMRLKDIEPQQALHGGEVVASESVVDIAEPCAQEVWAFQERVPIVDARLVMHLPAGWRAETVVFNHPPLEPVHDGAWVWEVRDVPALAEESWAPTERALLAMMAVTCLSPAGQTSDPAPRFAQWSDVSRWVASLMDPQALPGEPLASRARQLVSGARTRADSARAIGQYVQRLQYAEIELNLRGNGGMRPRLPATVLTTGYGDCKDKANLMRSMLAAVGIASFPVIISGDDPDFVRVEWPSPAVFNHCIVGLDLPQAPDSYPRLGSLVLFDPTDPYTAFGDLPEPEQGSLALAVTKAGEDLGRVSVMAAKDRLQDRRIDLTLAEDGSLSGTIREQACGQGARERVDQARGMTDVGLRQWAERWLNRQFGEAFVSQAAMKVDTLRGTCSWNFQFRAPHAGQLLGGKMIALKPFFVGSRDVGPCQGEKRELPLRLEAEAYRESVTVRLPAGYTIDDLPAPARVQVPFGSFETAAALEDGILRCTRVVELKPQRLEADRCSEVGDFLDKLRALETSALVATASR